MNLSRSLRMHITTLTTRVDSIEKSQAFISDKYDSMLNALQSVNKTTDILEKREAEVAKTTDKFG